MADSMVIKGQIEPPPWPKSLPLLVAHLFSFPGLFWPTLLYHSGSMGTTILTDLITQIVIPVPQGLESEDGIPLNKGNIYIARTSPPIVPEAYGKQFKTDFSSFLTLRENELIPGGRMLLTIMGRKSEDPFVDEIWKLLASVLGDMVREGLVEEYKLDSFNMPFYMVFANEIKEVIQAEGSFNIHRLELFEADWENTADECEVENVARCIRAVSEPMLVNHFGETIMEGSSSVVVLARPMNKVERGSSG